MAAIPLYDVEVAAPFGDEKISLQVSAKNKKEAERVVREWLGTFHVQIKRATEQKGGSWLTQELPPKEK